MTLSVENLNIFLKRTTVRYVLDGVNGDRIFHVVMGNEASDMDSMVSSLVYAHYLSVANGNDKNIYVPVFNIPREDFALRTETAYIFKKLGVSVEDIVFLETEVDAALTSLHKDGRLKLVLVDHNRLAKHQEKYGSAVDDILDHHKDENMYKPQKKDIRLVGSCTSLVAEKVLADATHKNTILQGGVVQLLLGTILLDTVNLDPKAEKVTPKDVEMSQALAQIIGYSEAQNNELFEVLQEERSNTNSLSTTNMLRADYKQWKMGKYEVGMSACRRSLTDWLKMDKDFAEYCDQYAKDKKLDILYIMTVYNDEQKQMRRELALLTHDKDLYSVTVDYLVNKTNLQLQSSHAEESKAFSQGTRTVSFFSQGNIGASRKQMQPFAQTLYDSLQ